MARKVEVPGAGQVKVITPFEIPYAQHHLNRLWEHVAAEREKAAAGMRGVAPTSVA